MKVFFIFLLVLFVSAFTLTNKMYKGIPASYHNLLDRQFNRAGENGPVIRELLMKIKKGEREAAAFLIAYMPEHDLKTLSDKFIADQIEWAYRARKEFVWCRLLPDSVFFNEVLPYYCLDERRDNWRRDFYTKFKPFVKNCKTIYEAIDSVNMNIRDLLLVDYNTKRSIVNISPFKAIEEKMATCSGLSFLLIDAFRAVGIPARLAGTPLWTNLRGNHSWVEVWIEGQWYFTEYYPDKLNKSWFVADAGKADPENPQHWIYATSYKPADTWFPMVWAPDSREIHACNVTDRYIRLYQKQLSENSLKDDELLVNVVVYKDPSVVNNSSGRVSEKVSAFDGEKVADFGFSPGPNDDLNRYLTLKLKKNANYVFKIELVGQVLKNVEVQTGEQSDEVFRLFLN